MKIVDFEAKHLMSIKLQDAQRYEGSCIDQVLADQIVGSYAFTALEGDDVVGCGGIAELYTGRGLCWTYISQSAKPRNFLMVHRAVQAAIKNCPIKRLEMTVDCEFSQGHRWANQLGFTLETSRMRHYRPDGGDCAMYVRFQ